MTPDERATEHEAPRSASGRAYWSAGGLFLLVVLSLEVASVWGDNGFVYRAEWSAFTRISPLVASVVLAFMLAFRLAWKEPSPALHLYQVLAGLFEHRFYFFAILLTIASLAAALAIAHWSLQAFANSGDEYAYLFQAETLAEGRLWNTPPPVPSLLTPFHVVELKAKWLGKFSPGYTRSWTILRW